MPTDRVAVIGAGPTGLYLAVALARRGREVVVVDRDTGPSPDGSWERRGVMQFHHPHYVRPQVGDALHAEMPGVWDDLFAAGAHPGVSPVPGAPVGMRCRRMLFERMLRARAGTEPGVTLRRGHVDDVLDEGGRAAGVTVDGARVEADLVIDASGRGGRVGRDRRAPAEGGDCGVAYVSRQYELLPGAEEGPTNSPFGLIAEHPGYTAVVFRHDNDVFSALLSRAGTDRTLTGLRHPGAFDAAAAAVPTLASWTGPERARPITPVLPGGRLMNTYRGQRDDTGRIGLPGLIFVGDAVCTTNPMLGRGLATSLTQAQQLVALLDEHPDDPAGVALAFDDWCSEQIRPWFDDHVDMDAEKSRRWAGHDVDLDRSLPSDLVAAAATVDPSLFAQVGPYLMMQAPPSVLDAAQPRAREIYADGWRPPVPEGPARDELADLVLSAAAARDGRGVRG